MGFGELTDILWLIFILGGIVVLIIWMAIMSKAIDQVSHDIRRMEPGAVWLCLIPLFGLVWQFLVMGAVADGVAQELQVRNIFPKEAKPGYAMGLTGCILLCCCIIPYGGIGLALIGLIFMVIHAVKIAEYNRVLAQSGRWETRYNQRMAELRQQQQMNWQNMQQPYQQPYQQQYQQPNIYHPPQYVPPPNYMPPPPQRSTHIPDTPGIAPKEKPKNPFE